MAVALPLLARGKVHVTGSGFGADLELSLRQCRIEAGLPKECGNFGYDYLRADAQGAFQADVFVTAAFGGRDGTEIDCRRVTCGVVADPASGYPENAALDFGPAPGAPKRYFGQVFDQVDLTEGIVYRHTTNSRGQAIDLKLDVYRPAGDTATRRPAVMWMFGGYFGSGDRAQLRDIASAMARRGYVSVLPNPPGDLQWWSRLRADRRYVSRRRTGAGRDRRCP